ncbi:hypothetical protein [Bartonella raoultii]|uniref:TNase-like domain-containing protein n=1 Tax=Bartonella raoultii TaxID=1457020 RepID=A0ABS7I3G7_9HYPH|nr:hypothetical protein [Bartonella raoultii]MBX4335219.1 hypothetical protein [Bartonella raoultii]
MNFLIKCVERIRFKLIVILYIMGSLLWGIHQYSDDVDWSVLQPFKLQDMQDIVHLYTQGKNSEVAFTQGPLANGRHVAKAESVSSFQKNSSFNSVAVFHGMASVTSGVTFKLFTPVAQSWRKHHTRALHLYGVDTCAPRQKAKLNNQEWPCGVVTMAWLVTKTLGQNLSCKQAVMRDGIYYAQCFVQGVDLAEAGLAEGMLLLAKDNKDPIPVQYRLAEETARNKKIGLWSSDFTEPLQWRRNNGSYNPFAHE